ncbi:hypothetical protein [Echinicola shivajiensis]|uniref:hypothetical protein n=1 Tax=Echinicola shivajiensis TaxID=1035916 RepID=UPI001BFC5A63|nr:hypothetical protein [Echinicola shivajiensis]
MLKVLIIANNDLVEDNLLDLICQMGFQPIISTMDIFRKDPKYFPDLLLIDPTPYQVSYEQLSLASYFSKKGCPVLFNGFTTDLDKAANLIESRKNIKALSPPYQEGYLPSKIHSMLADKRIQQLHFQQ